MSNKLHQHCHDQNCHADHSHNPKVRSLHRSWQSWVAAALMLIAILMYVFSLDEAVVPGPWLSESGQPAPAANNGGTSP